MTIRFKCPSCKKPLAVKDELAGRRGACPACKKAVVIPSPTAAAVDVEALAAAALADESQEKPAGPAAKPIKFTCPFCDEEAEYAADLGGKQAPCPSCKRIIKIPLPKPDKPKDWRELVKKGPSAALINQPEKIDEASWGTATDRGRVSREALEVAGAIVEVKEPVGVLGWVKRGVLAAVVVAALTGGYFAFTRKQSEIRTRDYLKEAVEGIEGGTKEQKLPYLLAAAIHRGAGEIKLRQDKAEEARREFSIALSYLRGIKDDPLEVDFALIEVALAQIEMGGTKEQVLDKVRWDWKEVQADLDKTSLVFRTSEGKAQAVRQVGGRLLDKGQGPMAISLSVGLVNSTPKKENPVALAPQIALLLALGDDHSRKMAEEQLKPPNLSDNKSIEIWPRIAYAEGHARQGKWTEAFKIAGFPGPDAEQLEAWVAVGAIASADAKSSPEAAKCCQEGLKALEGVGERLPPPWTLYRLARLALAADQAEQAKKIAGKLPAAFRTRLQLDKVLLQLQRTATVQPVQLVEEVADDKSPVRALAWCALARHYARLGRGDEVADNPNPLFRPMIALGLALGTQD